MSRFSVLCGAPLVALALIPVSASADEGSADHPEHIVVVGHPMEQAEADLSQRPGGVEVLSAKSYKDVLAVSLRDALAFSAGIYAQPRFGQEVRLSIRGSGLSRGFHMRGLMLLQDGVPINLADNNGDFQEFDPQIFDHIEVYRGANALRYGASTLGGAINAWTPTGYSAEGLEARIDGGSFNTLRTKVAAGFQDGRGDAYIAFTTDRGDGDRAHARRSAWRFNGNVGLQVTDRLETRFYATVSHIRQDLPGALTRAQALTDPGQSLPGNVLNDQERDIDSLRLQNRTTLQLDNGALEGGMFLNAKRLFHPIFQVIDQDSTDYGFYGRLSLKGEIAGMAVEGVAGATARFGHIDAKQYLNVRGQRGVLTYDARQSARTIDAYGEVRLSPVERLTLVVGGVYSDGVRERVVRFATPAAQDGRIRFSEFSPKLGVLYAPTADIQLFANYSRSAELPGYGEIFQSVGGTNAFIGAIRSQRAWTAEVGTRGKAGWLSWDIALYRAALKGEMLQFDLGPDIPAATFNAGRTLHQGVEAAVTVQPANWLRFRQTWLYSDFRFRGDAQFGNNRLPVVPRHALRSELRIGGDFLHVAPTLEWVPQGAFADYRNTVRAPGYALVGLTAGATVGHGIDLFVDVRNLTGKKAIGDISAAVQATDASAIYYPVERRGVYAGLTARF